MSTALLIQKSDTGVPLALTITQGGVGGVTGQSPTVAIRRGDSTTLYMDWADGVFKAVGWTTKYASMTEIERGHYVRVLNAATTAGILVGQILVAEYRVDDGATIKADAHDLISVLTTLYDLSASGATPAAIADAVWDEMLAGHLTPGSTGEALSDAAAGGAGLTPAQVTTAVWDEPSAAHTAAGTFGLMVNEIRVEEEEDDFRGEPA